MLRLFRERLTLILIALLPFHALLVTVGTKLIEGTGHAPLGWLALWKEAVLGVVLVLAVFEMLKNLRFTSLPTFASSASLGASAGRQVYKFDKLDALIISLLVLSIALLSYNLPSTTSSYLFGFKYDFIPLIAFMILRRVEWSDWFRRTLGMVLLWVGGIVALYGIATFFLPMGFFTALGYSDLHSLYVPDGPLAPFQQIGGSMLRRVQGPMSGPNQMGIWLLIPLGLLVSGFGFRVSDWRKVSATGLLLLVAIGLTFSRSAWIAAAVITLIALWQIEGVRAYKLRIVTAMIAVLIGAGLFFPSILLRIASSRGHIEKPLTAVATMIEHPLGLGLGTAGPASNRMSDACVHLEEGSDASWAQAHPDLCVFVGETQVQPSPPVGELRLTGQPVDAACNCPFVTENWYLQIGVELGWLGFVLYVVLIGVTLNRLRVPRSALEEQNVQRLNAKLVRPDDVRIGRGTFLAFLAVCIAGLFLHAFEDSAVAYTVWLLVAVALPPGQAVRSRT